MRLEHNSHEVLLIVININLPLKLFCSSFLVVIPINNGRFLIYKFFWQFPVFSGFRFLSQSIFKNVETTENFDKLISQNIKTLSNFDYFSNNFLHLGRNSQSVAQIHQGELNIEA